jgi:ribose transport system substrate-binding protein
VFDASQRCRYCWKFLLFVAGLTAGCGTPGTRNGPERPRIALIMKSLANEFFATMAEGARRHQADHAAEYDLIINGIKDERDLNRQVALVEEMIAQGVDAIVIAPADSQALIPVLRRAVLARTVVVNIDNKLDAEVLRQADLHIAFVGPDNRAGARRVGEYLAGQLHPGDSVALLEGIRSSFNGQQRQLGFQDAMTVAGMEIVDSQSAQWEMTLANQVAAAMLSEHSDLKAILACNDSMALGALAAIRASGKAGQVKVVGFDNISAVQQAVREGQITATADQHADQLAVFGIEYALQLLADDASVPEDRETPVDLITADVLVAGDTAR